MSLTPLWPELQVSAVRPRLAQQLQSAQGEASTSGQMLQMEEDEGPPADALGRQISEASFASVLQGALQRCRQRQSPVQQLTLAQPAAAKGSRNRRKRPITSHHPC